MLNISGSDGPIDLIEVNGGTYREEFVAVNGLAYVYLSTGMVLRWRREPEGWRVTTLDPGAADIPVTVVTDHWGHDGVTVHATVRWVGVSEQPPVVAA